MTTVWAEPEVVDHVFGAKTSIKETQKIAGAIARILADLHQLSDAILATGGKVNTRYGSRGFNAKSALTRIHNAAFEVERLGFPVERGE